MMDEKLPAAPLADDLPDRIAKEVAALVMDHLEAMYPQVCQVYAWSSAKRSIQGVVRNSVSAAGKAAERGRADQWIAESASHRRRFKAMRKKTGWGCQEQEVDPNLTQPQLLSG